MEPLNSNTAVANKFFELQARCSGSGSEEASKKPPENEDVDNSDENFRTKAVKRKRSGEMLNDSTFVIENKKIKNQDLEDTELDSLSLLSDEDENVSNRFESLLPIRKGEVKNQQDC